ncbi:unnamed protein product, partial [Staurois parvus]
KLDTYLSLAVLPAAIFSGRPVFPATASSVWTPGCDSLWLHSRVLTAHARVVLHFVNGPAVFWDLSRVPEDYGEGGGRTTSTSDSLGQWKWEWEWVPVNFEYLPPPLPNGTDPSRGA